MMVSELVGAALVDVRRTVGELGGGGIDPGAAVEAVVGRLRRLGEALAYEAGSPGQARAVFDAADREQAAGATADVLPRLEELAGRMARWTGLLADGERDTQLWS
ncbi:hypothetical protein A5768_11340 [Mycolicibacterium fortuitum]|nr:hypothetical protein A5768_11340 [Mycolicibacterium fortuitum]